MIFRRKIADVLIVFLVVVLGALLGFDNLSDSFNSRSEDAASQGRIYWQLDRLGPHWRSILTAGQHRWPR
jgi:hypothetical protein